MANRIPAAAVGLSMAAASACVLLAGCAAQRGAAAVPLPYNGHITGVVTAVFPLTQQLDLRTSDGSTYRVDAAHAQVYRDGRSSALKAISPGTPAAIAAPAMDQRTMELEAASILASTPVPADCVAPTVTASPIRSYLALSHSGPSAGADDAWRLNRREWRRWLHKPDSRRRFARTASPRTEAVAPNDSLSVADNSPLGPDELAVLNNAPGLDDDGHDARDRKSGHSEGDAADDGGQDSGSGARAGGDD